MSLWERFMGYRLCGSREWLFYLHHRRESSFWWLWNRCSYQEKKNHQRTQAHSWYGPLKDCRNFWWWRLWNQPGMYQKTFALPLMHQRWWPERGNILQHDPVRSGRGKRIYLLRVCEKVNILNWNSDTVTIIPWLSMYEWKTIKFYHRNNMKTWLGY